MTPPLSGVRVLDLGLAESGPSCTQALAWYGADVIRIDRPPAAGVPIEAMETPLYLANNMNKRSVLVDFTTTEGRDIVLGLAGGADVFVENFRTGTTDGLGLGFEDLRAVNPGIIYCSIKGFGSTGPRSGYPAFDPVIQAASGAMSVTGDRDGPPFRTGYMVGDSSAGAVAAGAILAALVRKGRTGQGAFIDLSMQEVLMGSMRSHLMIEGFDHRTVLRNGNRMTPPTDCYPCAPGGPNDFVNITAPGDKLFDRFAIAIDRPDLVADERFSSHAARREHGAELREIVKVWTMQRTKWEAMDHLASHGVPASAVYDSDDLRNDGHLTERGAILEVHHPERGAAPTVNNPVRADGLVVELQPAPRPGEHTEELLAELAGGRGDPEPT